MALKKFIYKGKTLGELQQMSLKEFAKLVPSRLRRSLNKGFTDAQKRFLKKLEKKRNVKTHCRDIVIIPSMVGKMVLVYNGKQFVVVDIHEDMLGHCLGEFVMTRIKVKHNAPGIGATRSSASVSVR